MSEALRLADALEAIHENNSDSLLALNVIRQAGPELRRLHDLVTEDSILQRRQRDEIGQLGQALARSIERNNELEAELHEQARVNGMGGEREARLMAELERKSDAIQRLWKERDELRSECRTLVRQNGEWQELNAELVEALHQIRAHTLYSPTGVVHLIARAALAKVEASK